MTTWSPEPSEIGEPKYLSLVDALSRDIDSGRLAPGSRLPTQRELATRLGLAIGTVSRAYAIAERRGIVRGEVGRGTFVRADGPNHREGADEQPDPGTIDLSRGRLVRPSDDPVLSQTLRELAQRRDLHQLIEVYQAPGGMGRHRSAGAAWLKRAAMEVDPGRVVITNGAQHGATVVLASIAQPGDLLLTEQVTYSGITALGRLQQLKLQALPMDGDGLLPDGLESACRTGSPRALFCMPNLQNPTGSTMSLQRRRDLVEVIRQYGLLVLEDDVNGFLPPDPLPPIAALAPELTFYITGTSKSLAPGLRVGYVAPPASQLQDLQATMQATTWFTAPLMAEIVTQWIETGRADEMTAWKRSETAARYALAREILGPWFSTAATASFHLWLQLPEPWRAESFVGQARARGVIVNSPDEFLVDRGPAPHAVRVCLGAGVGRPKLLEGLTVLAELLRNPPGLKPMVY